MEERARESEREIGRKKLINGINTATLLDLCRMYRTGSTKRAREREREKVQSCLMFDSATEKYNTGLSVLQRLTKLAHF